MKLRALHEPHYITFTDDSIQRIAERVAALKINYWQCVKFIHLPLPLEAARAIIPLIPFSDELSFQEKRVSLFITPPRTYYRAHKDGLDLQWGLNYPIHIYDDKAVTRFYSDESVEGRYTVGPDGKTSREVLKFNPLVTKPVEQFTMRPDEAVLINVNRYHDFNNRSDRHRVILTLRSTDLTLTFSSVADRFKAHHNAQVEQELQRTDQSA